MMEACCLLQKDKEVLLPLPMFPVLKKNFFFKFIFGCAGSLLLCGFSLVVGSGSHSLVVLCELVIVLACLVGT